MTAQLFGDLVPAPFGDTVVILEAEQAEDSRALLIVRKAVSPWDDVNVHMWMFGVFRANWTT